MKTNGNKDAAAEVAIKIRIPTIYFFSIRKLLLGKVWTKRIRLGPMKEHTNITTLIQNNCDSGELTGGFKDRKFTTIYKFIKIAKLKNNRFVQLFLFFDITTIAKKLFKANAINPNKICICIVAILIGLAILAIHF